MTNNLYVVKKVDFTGATNLKIFYDIKIAQRFIISEIINNNYDLHISLDLIINKLISSNEIRVTNAKGYEYTYIIENVDYDNTTIS